MASKKSFSHSSWDGNLGVVMLLGSVIEWATKSGIISSVTPIAASPLGRPIFSFNFSLINISLYADSKEELLKIDQLTKKLGDSKKGWVKEIKRSLKIDKDLGLTLLFSEKAAVSKELMDARLELTKEDKCL